jgi:hypothetical protein
MACARLIQRTWSKWTSTGFAPWSISIWLKRAPGRKFAPENGVLEVGKESGLFISERRHDVFRQAMAFPFFDPFEDAPPSRSWFVSGKVGKDQVRRVADTDGKWHRKRHARDGNEAIVTRHRPRSAHKP